MSQAMKLAEQASDSAGQRGLVGIGKVSEHCELTKLDDLDGGEIGANYYLDYPVKLGNDS